MTDARFAAERRSESSNDLELLVHALQEALTVIDDHDPDRNPARCMRQVRRILSNPDLRVAVTRFAADMPLTNE